MIPIVYSDAALDDLDRLAEFMAEKSPAMAERAMREIIAGIRVLEEHPFIGRPAEAGTRELVISFGRRGYVARYRATATLIEVLRVRHQREAPPN